MPELYMGEFIKGNLYEMVDETGYFSLPETNLAEHHVIIGASGSGKTETVLRISQGSIICYGYKVFFIDAKGDLETAEKFLTCMHDVIPDSSKITYFPDAKYNAWKGDARALYNKLIAILDFDDRAPWWKSVAQRTVWLALTSKNGIPRNSKSFLRLLDQNILMGLYKGTAVEGEIKKMSDIEGVSLRFHAFFDALEGKLDGQIAFENMDACYIMIPGFSLKLEAASLGRFFMEEIAQYLAGRKRRDEKVLFVVDEYSAIKESSAGSAVNLATRARSFGAGVVFTVQSYAGLGESKEAEEILDSVNGLILHLCSNPEKLVSRAGTRKSIEVGRQIDDGEATGAGTARIQEQFRVPPNEVRRFNKGECAYISGGKSATIQVQMLHVSDEGHKMAIQHFKNDTLQKLINTQPQPLNEAPEAAKPKEQRQKRANDQKPQQPPIKFKREEDK